MVSSSSRVVLVVCCCLLLSLSVESYSSARHIVRSYVVRQARAAKAPTETVGGYTFAERTVNNVTAHTGGNSTGKPKRTVVSKNPRDWTPYNFRDSDGEYDAPFINEAMWWVDKNPSWTSDFILFDTSNLGLYPHALSWSDQKYDNNCIMYTYSAAFFDLSIFKVEPLISFRLKSSAPVPTRYRHMQACSPNPIHNNLFFCWHFKGSSNHIILTLID